MMAWLALTLVAGCTPDAAEADDSIVHLDAGASYAYQPEWCEEWGVQVGAGLDVDHDGVQEWMATAPSLDFGSHFVEVWEDGAQEPGRSSADGSGSYGYSAASGGDTDGDGFGDYVVSHHLEDGQTWMQLVRGTDPADDIRLLLPEDYRGFVPGPTAFVHVHGRDQVLMTSYASTTRWRVDLFDLEGVAPGSDVVAGEHTLVFAADPLDNAYVGTIAAVDVDGDGNDEWLGGRAGAGYNSVDGESWVCPSRIGLQIPDDCEVLAPRELTGWTGSSHAVGDLDGDGVPELVSTWHSAKEVDGAAHIMALDGTVLAHVVGTRGVQFGRSPTVFTSDDGTPWLLLAEHNSYFGPTRVYGFRGDQLMSGDGVVELEDVDAATIWGTGVAGHLGWSMATYRPTPDAPLQLVIGEPHNGAGVVYVIDAP